MEGKQAYLCLSLVHSTYMVVSLEKNIKWKQEKNVSYASMVLQSAYKLF